LVNLPERGAAPVYVFVLPWSLSGVGGVNQVVINLAREMQKQGHFQPLILITDWDAAEPAPGSEFGLPTLRWRVRAYRSGMNLKERLAYWLWERRFRAQLEQLCRDRRVAAINVHYPGASALALQRCIAAMAQPVPLILSFHGADLGALRRAPPAEQALWAAALPRADALVTCSRDLRRQLLDICGEQLNVSVIHNGLDAAGFAAMASVAPEPARAARTILNVAKFEHKKGQDVLLDAFATLVADFPDLTLVLAGASEHALPELERQAARLGVSGRVRLLRDVPHTAVAQLFAGATVFALPSRQEPFGIVLLEAGACGLPVVASAVGGVPEILEDGITAHLVPPDDAARLAQALRTVLDDPGGAQAMGARLREHVRSHFSWRASTAGYAALLPDVSLSSSH
jgi:glycosyltransferase involved in cell wall biosynthesis